jgi:hypothetical protein
MTIRIASFVSLVLAVVAAGCNESPGRSPAPTSQPATSPAGSRPVAKEAAVPPRRSSVTPREVTFDDIKLDMEKGSPFSRELLPKRVTALGGTPIRIRGYILPSFQQRGLTQFVLVRDNQECCFGPGAALHDCIVVRMRPGKTADFSIRPVAVAGTFRIDELRGPDGTHLAIYAMDADEAK